jgi:hypothetical protein
MREELMEKERYETPLMDVVWFEAEDVITTSGEEPDPTVTDENTDF